MSSIENGPTKLLIGRRNFLTAAATLGALTFVDEAQDFFVVFLPTQPLTLAEELLDLSEPGNVPR